VKNCVAEDSLTITDGKFSWLPATTVILDDINLKVPTGSLSAIVGPVGCGKSSLLSACIGDLYKHSGEVTYKVSTLDTLTLG